MADGYLVSEVSKPITSISNGKLGTKPLPFSDVVQGLRTSQNQSAPLYASTACNCAISCPTTFKPVSYFEGKPCIAFAVSEVKRLEANLQFALIGKFSHGRPSLKSIHEFLAHLKLNGSFNLVTLDKKHVLIECSNLEDFHRLWLKLVWYIDGFHMRMFKWEPSYTPEKESSIAPVWIGIEGLPLQLFDDMPLRSIANSIGKPIKIDPRNMNRTLLSAARVCVELDVSKPFVDAIRLSFVDDVTGIEVESRWLQVYYDVVPQYCVFCFDIGHGMANCKRAIQEVTNVPDKSATSSSAEQLHFKQVWLPVVRNKTLFTTEKQQAEANNATVMVDAETQILEVPSSHSGAAKESSGAGQVSPFLALNIPDQTSSHEPQQPENSAKTAGHQSAENYRPGVASEQLTKEVQLQPSEQIAVQVQLDDATDQQVAENSAEEVAHQIEQVIVPVLQDALQDVAQMQIAFATTVSQTATTPSQVKRPAGQVVDEGRTAQTSDSTVPAGATDNAGHLAAAGATDHLAACDSSAHSAQDIAGQLSDVALQQSLGANQVHDQIGCFQELSTHDKIDATKRHQLSKQLENGAAVVPAAIRNGAQYADSTQTQDQINEQTTVHQLENQPIQPSQQPATFQAQRARFLRPSWADQVQEEKGQSTLQTAQQMEDTHTSTQDQVTTNSRSKDHYMALEHTFELHTEREQGAIGNFFCIPIPHFYDLSPQEQKADAAIIMAEFYWYFVRNALEEEIEKDSKDNKA